MSSAKHVSLLGYFEPFLNIIGLVPMIGSYTFLYLYMNISITTLSLLTLCPCHLEGEPYLYTFPVY